MYKLLLKLFIKDHENTADPIVRERYGTVVSLFSIICNFILVGFKLFVSFVSGSVSIMADAMNNLSDVGSNIAAMFGFKLANKHPDGDHPYGHGRMEYISGMVVSFLILYVAVEAIISSVKKIIHPEDLSFSIVSVVILIVSIGIKLIMAHINKSAGNDIGSDTLKAAGQDSLNDSLMTAAALLSLLVYGFTSINIDAYVGLVVSVFVLKAGIGIFKDVLDTILGKAPDRDLVKKIEKLVMEGEHVVGIHDLIMHDYGPSHQFMSLHAEVDAAVDIFELHDIIDNIEARILMEYNILTTIHLDPINPNDELTNSLKKLALDTVKEIDERYNIHDFRIVPGPTHTNLIFDVLVPSEERTPDDEIRKNIAIAINKKNNTYFSVIHVDHSYV